MTCHALANKAVLGAVFDGLLLAMQAEQDRMCERGLLDANQKDSRERKTRDGERKDTEQVLKPHGLLRGEQGDWGHHRTVQAGHTGR